MDIQEPIHGHYKSFYAGLSISIHTSKTTADFAIETSVVRLHSDIGKYVLVPHGSRGTINLYMSGGLQKTSLHE